MSILVSCPICGKAIINEEDEMCARCRLIEEKNGIIKNSNTVLGMPPQENEATSKTGERKTQVYERGNSSNFKVCPVCNRNIIPVGLKMCFSCQTTLPPERLKPEQQIKISTENKDLYFVYQGTTFEYERNGGYVWAPRFNQKGFSFDHWSRVGLLAKGDIILHSVARHIVAVSIVESEKYETCPHPDGAWGAGYDLGRKVDCKYINLRYPVSSLEVFDAILRYKDYSGSPFNKNGEGKQGYMFDLDRKIFNAYAEKIMERNPYITFE